MILASGLFASLISMHSIYWFLPLILIVVPVVGFLREILSMIDIGIITTIFFYFFVNRELSLTIINLISIVGFLFLFVGIWFLARYILLLGDIEDNSRKGSRDGHILSFSRDARKFTVYGILTNIVLGAFLSIIASLMGSYGSLGRVTTGQIETILMIVFSLALFFVIYKMIDLMAAGEG